MPTTLTSNRTQPCICGCGTQTRNRNKFANPGHIQVYRAALLTTWESYGRPVQTSCQRCGYRITVNTLTLNCLSCYGVDAFMKLLQKGWISGTGEILREAGNYRRRERQAMQAFEETCLFGIEIECISIPRTRRTYDWKALMEGALTSAGLTEDTSGIDRTYTGPASHRSQQLERPNTQPWTIVGDGSVYYRSNRRRNNTGSHEGQEIRSPILRGEEGLAQLKRALRAVIGVGTGINRTCGLHVHHSAANLTSQQMIRLVTNYTRSQGAIDLLVPDSRHNGSYARYWFDDELTRLAGMRDRRDLENSERYKTINLQSLGRHGTVEFRQHNGTLNYQKIAHWVSFGRRMIKRAMEGRIIEAGNDLPALLDALAYGPRDRDWFLRRGGLLAPLPTAPPAEEEAETTEEVVTGTDGWEPPVSGLLIDVLAEEYTEELVVN